MKDSKMLKISEKTLLVPLFAVLAIWMVYWAEVRFDFNFNHWGIQPRSPSGLKGVFFSPFIHSSVEHLYNNTIPLAVLTFFLFLFYRTVAFRVLLLGVLGSGILTWVIGRPSYHIGASGLIYVLASFIFFKGIFTKHYRLVALSLIVVFVYGSMIWYIFPVKDGISWEGHLSGFLTGLLLALLLKVYAPQEKKYDWEKEDFDEKSDPFLQHFDADGNFIGTSEKLERTNDQLEIRYHFKPGEDKEP
ncbi:rhomboid family intramembrane serine protease [Flagellimonas meridianipacifica]|uniref:Membrane associated rhomboid family serine protease n=1 Tax=Flagellimonas meridianipacifica TaxID=1080225 RepID=A0A2T0M895_9FLAO|nr:rhomboid family intramembrane serine protease [Allomuricauda pacifica]PRX53689.1 membrane associated rhomboid family serine protease [Allomuricauda pacifica]